MSKVKSPCINVCKYNKEKCIACQRTLQEIANWNNYSDAERVKILQRIYNERLEKENYWGDPF